MSNEIQTYLTPEYKDKIIRTLRDLTEKKDKNDKITLFLDKLEHLSIDNIPSMNTADIGHIYNSANNALKVIEQIYNRYNLALIRMHEFVNNLAVILCEKGEMNKKRQ